jgi:hypothetical protein
VKCKHDGKCTETQADAFCVGDASKDSGRTPSDAGHLGSQDGEDRVGEQEVQDTGKKWHLPFGGTPSSTERVQDSSCTPRAGT